MSATTFSGLWIPLEILILSFLLTSVLTWKMLLTFGPTFVKANIYGMDMSKRKKVGAFTSWGDGF